MEFSSNKLACWSLCKSTDDCNWFSYGNDSVNPCHLYETCPEIEENPQFISGQKECKYDYGEMCTSLKNFF